MQPKDDRGRGPEKNEFSAGRQGDGKLSEPIYMDYQATTPVDPRVLEAMLPWFNTKFGNPHSQHNHGWQAYEAVESARTQIAQLIGAQKKEIIITSGATESNNLAIKGVGKAYVPEKNHIVTCVTEHQCVLESCLSLEQEGFEVTRLEVDASGFIDLDQLRRAITSKTMLVTIMAVNNEIGTINPLHEIGKICKETGTLFHTDAAQAVGKISLDVDEANIDLLSISAHKLYGPKGIGALYVRRRPRVRLEACISGGGQERGLRSGTLSTPLCVGFGVACMIAEREMQSESIRIRMLRDYLCERLISELDNTSLNGDMERRIPGNLSISFAHIDGSELMMEIPELSVSTGSACTTSSVGSSHVLRALGLDADIADTTLRIGLGRFSTKDEVEYAAEKLISVVNRQIERRFSSAQA